MDDFIFGLFGCLIVLGIFAVPIALFVVIFRRLGQLERETAQLRHQLALSGAPVPAPAQPAPAQPAPAQPAPAQLAEKAPRAPSADTVVTTPTPAFFETKAVAEPAAAPALPADRPASVETVVSTPLPALFETQVSAPPAAAPAAPPPAAAPAAPARPPKKGRSLEETLWTRLPVWIGAVALALAAAYLVKLSFDRGWIGPALRVVLGVLFGATLLGAGEWLRKSSDYVAKGLSAAGIAALFVSFFTATTVYQLVSPTAGFALMALTTATAVALSLRQGYIVAIVGLLGGFLTPALAGGAATESAVLFVYLLLLEVGLVVIARRRSWGSLPALALAGGLLWVFSRLSGEPSAADSTWIGLFLVLTTGLFLLGLQTAGRPAAGPERREIPLGLVDAVRWVALGGALFAMTGLLASRNYGTLEWIFLGLIAGGAFALARIDERYHGFAWLASAMVTFLLSAYAGQVELSPERAPAFLYTHLAFGALIAGGAFLAHFGSRYAGRFAALSSLAGVAYLLVQYFESERLGTAGLSWGAIALALALLYTVAAVPAARRRLGDSAAARRRLGDSAAHGLGDSAAHGLGGSPEAAPRAGDPSAEAPLAAFAVGATTLLSLAVPLELERQWLTVAWALEVWALMWLAQRLEVRALRVCAALLSALVAIRLLLNPEVISYPIGSTPIFNWLLYGYGIPLAAFLAAARLARRQVPSAAEPGAAAVQPGAGSARRAIWLAELFEWLAQAFAFALVSLEIRHFFYRDAGNLGLLAPGATDTHLVEWGTYASFWLLLVFLQLALAERFPSRPLRLGIRIAFIGLAAIGILFTSLVLNPLWSAEYVGATPVFNWLLWIYGLPALLRLFLASRFERRGELWLARIGNLLALFEIFLLITFEVRQAFHGSRLDTGAPSTAESYAYSFAWIALAFVMAVIGVKAGRKGLRLGSAIIMAIAVFKVFLFDTSSLEGIYRVLSLFGLGVALFVLAYLYRRFVFPPEAETETPEAEDPPPGADPGGRP